MTEDGRVTCGGGGGAASAQFTGDFFGPCWDAGAAGKNGAGSGEANDDEETAAAQAAEAADVLDNAATLPSFSSTCPSSP